MYSVPGAPVTAPLGLEAGAQFLFDASARAWVRHCGRAFAVTFYRLCDAPPEVAEAVAPSVPEDESPAEDAAGGGDGASGVEATVKAVGHRMEGDAAGTEATLTDACDGRVSKTSTVDAGRASAAAITADSAELRALSESTTAAAATAPSAASLLPTTSSPVASAAAAAVASVGPRWVHDFSEALPGLKAVSSDLGLADVDDAQWEALAAVSGLAKCFTADECADAWDQLWARDAAYV